MKYNVDLRAAFVGLTFLPNPVVIGTNNINPLLILHDQQIEYRNLFTTNKLSYSNIKQVDIYMAWHTNNIIFTPTNGVFTVNCNVRSKAQFLEALKLLQEKGLSLSDKALAYINCTED